MPIDMTPLAPNISECWKDMCHETLRKMPFYVTEVFTEYGQKGFNWLVILTIAIFILFVWNIIYACVFCCIDPANNTRMRLTEI